jgi:hypothetical protein
MELDTAQREKLMKTQRNILRLVASIAGFATCSGYSQAASPSPAPVNYARPFEPPTRPAFIPLPAGAVEPAGWLRDWCLAARDGFTGHMDEYDAEFRRAWAADHKMTGDRLDWPKGGWPFEGGCHPLPVVAQQKEC